MTTTPTVAVNVASNELTSTSTSTRTGTSGFAGLSPDVQRSLNRRLAGLAICYSSAYFVLYAYWRVIEFTQGLPVPWPLENHVVSIVSILMGLAVALLARAGRIPPARFADLAITFEFVAGVGIVFADWRWEHRTVVGEVPEALGFATSRVVADFVAPLTDHGINLLYTTGPPWVAVWLLCFAILLPLPPRKTIMGTLLTAALVPALWAGSPLVNGAPVALAAWIPRFVIESTVAAFVCAGIAIAGAKILYSLTRDLSRAQELGSYHLVARLGVGGMGEVWRAEHRMLARPAAIKLIRPESLGGHPAMALTALQRFEREARSTARLTSPHTIELYDFGTTGDGTFYYVMELLNGLDLETLVERHGPLPPARCIHVLRQVCDSLADAHFNGLIHRDVKPANIFTCCRGRRYDVVKVLDFGLVKESDELGARDVQLTMEGEVSGTPGYMAPEQVLGTGLIDARTDIYALGCVAYWLLTGTLVFSGSTSIAVMTHHARTQPAPPSAQTEIEIPAELDAAVLACLQKDPTLRPQSAEELGELLARCEALVTPWTHERAAKWWSYHAPA